MSLSDSDAPYTKLPSGLQYRVIRDGDGGEKPAASSTVTVHYTGVLEDGEVFDTTSEDGDPATFPLRRVIKGWTEGLQLMTKGAIFQFVIPHELAYGARGAGDDIPPYETLTFEVELLSFK
ncbi:MAG: FKBP-type peptidyl-prolyl cis-trans isomerase [Verrucomicrobiales bacterium]